MRLRWSSDLVRALLVGVLSCDAAKAQPQLGNAEVIEMVRGGLPEGTIVRMVQSGTGAFDVSPSALITLHAAGVSERILDSMIAAAKKRTPAARGARRSATRAASPDPSVAIARPSVVIRGSQMSSPLALVGTALARTEANAPSLATLATESLIDEAVSTGVATARRATGRVGRAAGGAAKVVSRALSGGDRTLTYVWMLPAGSDVPVVPSTRPVFEVSLNGTAGVAAGEYAPAVVRLTPTNRGTLLVGATGGKTPAPGRATDWPLYSRFVEDRVAIAVASDQAGWRVEPVSPLLPGDYAVVMRPIAKDKKFSGADVARNQGDGLMFNAAWPFSIR